MKKIYAISLLIPFILLSSCEEDFSPKADYLPKYSLNCIVRSDTSLQVATVLKSYDVPEFDPYANHSDPFVEGSFVRMWTHSGDEVFVFSDSSISRDDTSRYNTPAKFYFTKLDELVPDDSIEIEAILPNGRRLNGKTKVPHKVQKNFADSDNTIPPEKKDAVTMAWIPSEPDLLYHPLMTILYFRMEDGKKVKYIKKVPLAYVEKDGVEVGVFAKPSRNISISTPMSVITKALADLSEGDDDKSRYIIQSAKIELLVFDRYLAGYYSSTSKIVDQFSVEIDEIDFTNITGGFGIFGCYLKQNFPQLFEQEYIRSFGYTPGI